MRAGDAPPESQQERIKRELESELKGLLMAARLHGFTLAMINGKPAIVSSGA